MPDWIQSANEVGPFNWVIVTMTTKIAIILNSDHEPRHTQNVEMANKALVDMGYTTYVASVDKPDSPCCQFVDADTVTADDIYQFVGSVTGTTNANTDLVIYSTGHGYKDAKSDETALFQPSEIDSNTLVEKLDNLAYERRVVIMDQCEGGNFASRFLDDSRTLFVSSGSINESVCCNEFAPYFWSATIAIQGDKPADTWQKRFAAALTQGPISSHPQFVMSPGFVDLGMPAFDNTIHDFASQDDLDQELNTLQPGQYAIALFSQPHCGPCLEYDAIFTTLAGQSNGQFLFLKTLATADAEFLVSPQIQGTPTVIIFDWQKNPTVVLNRNNVFGELAQISTPLSQRTDNIHQLLASADPQEQALGLRMLEHNAEAIPLDVAANFCASLRCIAEAGNPTVAGLALRQYSKAIAGLTPDQRETEFAEINKQREASSSREQQQLAAYLGFLLIQPDLTTEPERALSVIRSTFENEASLKAWFDDAESFFDSEFSRSSRYEWSCFLEPACLNSLQPMILSQDPVSFFFACQAYRFVAFNSTSVVWTEQTDFLCSLLQQQHPSLRLLAMFAFQNRYCGDPADWKKIAEAHRPLLHDTDPRIRHVAVQLFFVRRDRFDSETLLALTPDIEMLAAGSDPDCASMAQYIVSNILDPLF